MPYHLITVHGTIVVYDAETAAIKHARIPFGEGDKNNEWRKAVIVDFPHSSLNFHGFVGGLGYVWHRGVDGLLSFGKAGNFLRATPDGCLDTKATVVGTWEKFCLIEVEDLRLLHELADHNWIARSPRHLMVPKGSVQLDANFFLSLEDIKLELTGRFPALRDTMSDDSVVLFVNGWKLVSLYKYRPIVCCVALGSSAQLEMACLALKSFQLRSPALLSYLIITDQTAYVVDRFIEALGLEEIMTYRPPPALDLLDAYLLRYELSRWPDAQSYGPFLYVDTDVICEADPSEMLYDLATSSKIEVAAERYSPLGTRQSVGADLLQEDNASLPWEYGFNSGVIGFYNVVQSAPVFRLIVEVTHRCAEKKGRIAYQNWHDQVPANYVAVKAGGVGMELLTDRVAQMLGFEAETGNYVLSQTDDHVLTHLWGAGTRRPEIMRAVVAELREAALKSQL